MSKYLAVVVVVLQGLVLAYMAAEREWVMRTGQVVHLRTAPIDPRDVMRGDYVRLDYEISRVPCAFWRDGLAASSTLQSGMRGDLQVYAALRENDDGLAELVSLSDFRPREGLFLRGRGRPWRGRNPIFVRYGIEGYFQEQGQARELELRRNREGLQVPLEMAVAVGGNGMGVILGHRWSELGIGLDLDRQQPTDPSGGGQPGVLLSAKVRLLNASDRDVALVDLPGARALALVPDQRGPDSPWHWVGEGERPPDAGPEHVLVLRPGQVHTLQIDFQDPAWFIVDQQKAGAAAIPMSLIESRLAWGARFRFEYRPPSREACRKLPHASLIWHGRLPSRAFGAMGGID